MGNVRVSMDAYEKDYVQAAKTLEKMWLVPTKPNVVYSVAKVLPAEPQGDASFAS